jgi:hypothetical protein
MNKVYYVIANGGNYTKPVVEKIVFEAKDKLSKEDIIDCLNDICSEHAQSFAYATVVKEKDFLAIQALNPTKIKTVS